jgi:hypothetical protein
MSLRILAAAVACFVTVGAFAADKKKLDYAPETGPQPRAVESPPMTLPSPHYLEGHPPEYFPEEPPLPLTRERAHREETAGKCSIRVYNVGDLVVPIPAAGERYIQSVMTHEADLIKKLTASVEPKCWASAGGPATVEYVPLGMALVVNAPTTVHEAVECYLERLRKMQDTQFTIEIAVLTVTDAGLEKLGLAREFLGKPGELRSRIKFLAGDEVGKLDPHGPDVQLASMPKLTVLNDQEGSITVGEVQHFLTGASVEVVKGQLVIIPKNEPHQLGIACKVRPQLSADGKFIKLALAVQSNELAVQPVGLIPLTLPVHPLDRDGKEREAVPFTQFLQDPKFVTRSVDETVTLPDGGTVVVYGGPATTEQKVRETSPLFEDVPFLDELFAKDKKVTGTNHLLVFATPRAIRPDCDECVQCAGGGGKLLKLILEYQRACREGNSDEARRLALECLVIDPTCFSKK